MPLFEAQNLRVIQHRGQRGQRGGLPLLAFDLFLMGALCAPGARDFGLKSHDSPQ
jgi:hypothetical protein